MTPAQSRLLALQQGSAGEGQVEDYDKATFDRVVETLSLWDADRRRMQEENLQKRLAWRERYRPLLPTPLQSIDDYGRLVDAKEGIDRELSRVGEYRPVSDLVFGSCAHSSLNALSSHFLASGESLIVFNRGLLLALLGVTNLAACAMSFDAAAALDAIDSAAVRLLVPRYQKLLAAVQSGQAPLDLTIPLFHKPEKEHRWTALEDAAFGFVFAHEYAHVLRGHLAAQPQEDSEWGDEYEADSLGLDLVAQMWLAKFDRNPAALRLCSKACRCSSAFVVTSNGTPRTSKGMAPICGASRAATPPRSSGGTA